MAHIKRAAKRWMCNGCDLPIKRGMRHFCVLGPTLPYGRYITSMVEARYHIECAQLGMCCKRGDAELRKEFGLSEAMQ